MVVDKSFYETTGSWKNNIHTLMNRLSSDFEDFYNISILVDTIIPFDVNKVAFSDKSAMECIYETLYKGTEDFTVYFSRGYIHSSYEVIGITRPDIGFVAAMQMDDVNIDMQFQYLYNTLLHEMCHLFGAVHVYGSEKSNFLMETTIRDNVTKFGKELVMKEPEMDRGNRSIIMGMSKRPFTKKDWTSEKWSKIESLYLKQMKLYNNSRIDETGRLVDFYQDHFIPSAVYEMLRIWASVCGNDSAAGYYIDKRIEYAKELCNSCNVGTLGGRSKLMCLPYYGVNSIELVKLGKIYGRYYKAISFLQSGKINEADQEIRDMLTEGKDYPSVNWKMIESQYNWERNNLWLVNPEILLK
ncbi:MAG: hypothetical protein JNL74_16700 [Fibrobacteres bacterium]|nr:hypothetical protein [Fibrobacterota bacterium]